MDVMARRRRSRLAVAVGLAGAVAWFASAGTHGQATADLADPPVVAQPVIGLPISQPILIGSSPGESPGETWGYTANSGDFQIVRYTPTGGWQVQPGPADAHGQPLTGFTPATGPLAGRTTSSGGVAIVGEDAAKVQQVIVRDPGGSFQETPTLAPEHEQMGEVKSTTPNEGKGADKQNEVAGKHEDATDERETTTGEHETTEAGKRAPTGESSQPSSPLQPGETLFASSGEGVLMAPVDQPSGHTAVFLVPFEHGSSVQDGVLFFDGASWTREPICVGLATEPQATCETPPVGFKVLAIDATSIENAWLLAHTGLPNEGVALFSRQVTDGKAQWVQRSLGEPGSLGARFAQSHLTLEGATAGEEIAVGVAARTSGQPLTVTSEGVWIDGRLTISDQAEPSDFTLYYSLGSHDVSTSWCSVQPALASLCTNPLESNLPNGPYRSFGWSGGGPYGQRVITGLENGVTLELDGTSFERVLGLGGEGGTSAGAAFSSPQEGWLADAGQLPLTHITTDPAPDRIQPWPVPFRHPLTSIATQPGSTPGELGAQAIAVGDHGQVAHYFPGQGWVAEALLSSSGVAQTPELRGIAWPEPGRAYAVGTNGSMWLWMSSTGLWEPDPARPPNLFLANFTGIAFDPSEPAIGYAIGQQGLLLSYGKSWQQEKLPTGLEGPDGADFLSIAFAGNEALAVYQVPQLVEGKSISYTGGVLANDDDGRGWHIDTQADEALDGWLPERVAGLPDGGAVLAGAGGHVIERQSQGAPWLPAPAGPLSGKPIALAPFREGGTLRVVVSVDTSALGSTDGGIDEALRESPPEGQAAVVTAPYRLPASGYLLRETASGWADEEHEDYPAPNGDSALIADQPQFDWPTQPDAVLALALAPDGSQGWAVGGQTGEVNTVVGGNRQEDAEAIQTAGVMRYPASGTPPTGFSVAPEQTAPGNATFAIGGDAQCATACADLAEDQLGPDQWLTNAIARAAQIPGVKAFLYTGERIAPGLANVSPGEGFGRPAFRREANRYAELLRGTNGSPPAFAAPSESDLDQGDTLGTFNAAFQESGAPQFSTAPEPAPSVRSVSPASPTADYFSFDSTAGAAGEVRVVVLDYSYTSLGPEQQCWLAKQLAQAKFERAPAIVIGARDLTSNGGPGNMAADATQVIPILVNGTPPAGCALGEGTPGEELTPGGASAYFFDYHQQNRSYPISAGGASIPTFGSGTLGYVPPQAQNDTEFLGASGFLLAEVETARRNPTTNRAPVAVKLIPDISDLALDATNGTLLRRSQASLFNALARRPHAGMGCHFDSGFCSFVPDPYVSIPTTCQGPNCSSGIFPEYTFTSSNPDIGNFVEPDPDSPEGDTVLQGPSGKPILDEHSGLFCAFNAGTTTVTIHTGGLSASVPVTVLSGSVVQPCGTTPLRNPPAAEQRTGLPVPPPPLTLAPTVRPNGAIPPPPPVPPAGFIPIHHPAKHHATTPPPVPLQAAQLFPILPLVPLPAPSVARPTPPSGTAQVPSQSPVSQQVSVTEREEEHQGATEMVHHMAAYRRPDEDPIPAWTLGLVLIAAVAGVGSRRRFGLGELAYAGRSSERSERSHPRR
jgi:hypothetical protein